MGKIKRFLLRFSSMAFVPIMALTLATVTKAEMNVNSPSESNSNSNFSNQNTNRNDYQQPAGDPSTPPSPSPPPADQNTNAPSAANTPSASVAEKSNNSVRIQVSYPSVTDTASSVQVGIWNIDNNTVALRTFNVSFNSEGMGTLTVSNLRPNTNYSFFVKVRQSGGNFTNPSMPVWAKTLQ